MESAATTAWRKIHADDGREGESRGIPEASTSGGHRVIVQARTSGSPAVKKVIKPSSQSAMERTR